MAAIAPGPLRTRIRFGRNLNPGATECAGITQFVRRVPEWDSRAHATWLSPQTRRASPVVSRECRKFSNPESSATIAEV
jgi:hypothetical protein